MEAVRRFLLRLIERLENYPDDDNDLHDDNDDEEAEGDGA